MEGKTVLKVLGGAAIVSTLFAFKKKADYSKVIEKMTMDIRNVRKFQVNSGKVYVIIDLAFHNPTDYDMNLFTAGMIKLKEIKLSYKGTVLGTTFSKETKFALPAKSNYVISNIQVEVLFLNIIAQLFNGGFDSNEDNYKVQTTLEALGKTWVVEQ